MFVRISSVEIDRIPYENSTRNNFHFVYFFRTVRQVSTLDDDDDNAIDHHCLIIYRAV